MNGIFLSTKKIKCSGELGIIGEAINQIHKLDQTVKISSKKQIISMRNRVIHGYDKVDDAIIWGIIVRHLPILKKEITALLDKDLKVS